MIYYVVALRDKKLGAYDMPVKFEKLDIEHITEEYVRGAKRCPEDMISDAADRALYYLGTFDDISGKFDLLEEPDKLLDLEDFVPRKETSK